MRDDSQLYTGVTSTATRRLKAREQKKREERERMQSQLKPAEEALLAFVDKQKESIAQMALQHVSAEIKDKDVKAHLLALNFYDQYLTQFKTQLSNVLRKHKRVLNQSFEELLDED